MFEVFTSFGTEFFPGTVVTQELEGESCLMQAEGSDVSLHVPESIYGTITSKTFTDHSKFQKLISDNECLVSPICEFLLDPDQRQIPADVMYTAKIPHSIPDVKKAENYIIVRQGEFHNNQVVNIVPIKRKNTEELIGTTKKAKHVMNSEPCYDIDENFVTVESRKLGVFIVTVEGLNCCSKSACCFLFGSLASYSDRKSLVKLKIYLSGGHKGIKDYESVSILYHG